MPELEEVYAAADRNYRESVRFLGDSVSLVEDLIQLYQHANDIAAGSPLAHRPEFFMGVQFSMASRYSLVTGVHACFRAHISDTFTSTRMAIEHAAFAARVKRHPQFADTWVRASRDPAAYEEYREKFKKLFPPDHEKLSELGRRYDLCAKHTHPSIHSFASRSTVEETDRHVNLKFDYFQGPADGSELVRTFVWILNTHLLILEVFREVLAEVLVADAETYDVQMNAIRGQFVAHRTTWLARIPTLRPEPLILPETPPAPAL